MANKGTNTKDQRPTATIVFSVMNENPKRNEAFSIASDEKKVIARCSDCLRVPQRLGSLIYRFQIVFSERSAAREYNFSRAWGSLRAYRIQFFQI
jgi:hypothetical protein